MFSRPIRWILALHGDVVVPFMFAGVLRWSCLPVFFSLSLSLSLSLIYNCTIVFWIKWVGLAWLVLGYVFHCCNLSFYLRVLKFNVPYGNGITSPWINNRQSLLETCLFIILKIYDEMEFVMGLRNWFAKWGIVAFRDIALSLLTNELLSMEEMNYLWRSRHWC